MIPSIALSSHFINNKGASTSTLLAGELLQLIRDNWAAREPGFGREDLDKVVVVPLQDLTADQQAGFACGWGKIEASRNFQTKMVTRAEGEDPYMETTAEGTPLPATSIRLVLYSAATLEEDGGSRSSEADWEVVALLVSPWADEPMDPLTMSRNFLRKPGGTYAGYSVEQFAESIYFWRNFVKLR
jgi:hypothetical protein